MTNDELKARVERIRLRNELGVEKVRRTRIQRRQEAAIDYWNTVSPVVNYLDQVRTPLIDAIASDRGNRKGGGNWPIWRTENDLSQYRVASRLLIETNPYAGGLVNGLAAYTIGSGSTWRVSPKKKPRWPLEAPQDAQVRENILGKLEDALQNVIDDFLKDSEWYGGEQPSLEKELFERSIEDGEFFLRHFPQDDGRVFVRVLEPEQITCSAAGMDSPYYLGCVNVPGDVQCIEGYMVSPTGDQMDADYVDGELVSHFKRNAKRGIKRGFPELAFDTRKALQLGSSLMRALGEGAAEQAAIVAVRQHAVGSAEDIQSFADDLSDTKVAGADGRLKDAQRLEMGRYEDIPEHMQYVSPPSAVNGTVHVQILGAVLQCSAVRGWNAPVWIVSGDASNNNYASSLVAGSPFVIQVEYNQGLYARCFEKTGWFVLKHYLSVHPIQLAGIVWTFEIIHRLFDLQVTFPSPRSSDPLKDSQTAQTRIAAGISSRQIETEKLGNDWNRVAKDNLDYLDEFGGDGADLPIPGMGGSGGGLGV